MTRRLFFPLAVTLAAVALAIPSARAQKPDAPALVLTAKSANELIADVRYLVTALGKADDPQVAPVMGMLDSLKDPAAFKGLDPSKPIGAYASLPEGEGMPSVVVFLPVLNAQTLIDTLTQSGLPIEADNSQPGFTHKLTMPQAPVPFFITSGGGYLYLSLSPVGADALKKSNPASLLPKRPGAGDLSLTVRLDRLGPQFQQGFNQGLEQSLSAQREKKPGEEEAAYQARLAFLKLSQDAFTALVRDGKELSLDLVIDPKTEFLGFELNSSATSGTPYAAALKKLAASKSKFRALSQNAAMAAIVSVPLGQGLRDMLGQAVDQLKTKALADPKLAENAAAKKAAEQLIETVRATVTAETLDAGMAIQGTGGEGAYSAVMAMGIKGGKNLDAALRDAIKSAPADKRKGLTLDAAKLADGTAVHKVVNPNTDAKVPAAFGGDQTAYVALRDDVVAFAVGKAGQAALAGAFGAAKLPASGGAGMSGPSAAPQVEFFISGSRAAGLADKPAERDAMKAAATEVFTGAAAKKDKVSITLRGQGEAMTLRLGADVPALKFFARVAEMQGKVNQ